jgi:type I site-specific restriction-modification system R (restriction) subunit
LSLIGFDKQKILHTIYVHQNMTHHFHHNHQ